MSHWLDQETLQTAAIGASFIMATMLIGGYGILTAIATDDQTMWTESVEQLHREVRTSLDALEGYRRGVTSWAAVNMTGRYGHHLALSPLEHHRGKHAIDGRELMPAVDWNGFTDAFAQLVSTEMAGAAPG